MSRYLLLIALLLQLTSCNRGQQDDVSLKENFKGRPDVVVTPIQITALTDTPWNLSDEFTTAIYQRLIQRDKIYLLSPSKVKGLIKRISPTLNPFGSDLSWMKQVFPQNSFVVFLELIQHEEAPLYATTEHEEESSPAEFNMTARIRIVDLRDNDPRVILQEMIEDTHYIPTPFTKYRFVQIPWQQKGFEISPLGLAHQKMTREISSRIEDYILLAADK